MAITKGHWISERPLQLPANLSVAAGIKLRLTTQLLTEHNIAEIGEKRSEFKDNIIKF